MKNISYFCNVKRIRKHLQALALAILSLVSNVMQATSAPTGDMLRLAHDMEISLLTCAPGQEVYSLYGHTAIKLDFPRNDSTAFAGTQDSFVANYGMFSFRKPFFILRFIFGLTDYEMGVTDDASFEEEYRANGRSVVQQTLNLTDEEKLAVWQALVANYRPENREYRYNYFYDNCTTRARDMLVGHINGKVVYAGAGKLYPSYRELIHQMNAGSPWARFGNDMLLGVKADKKTDLSERQFLPYNLMHDFATAKIVGGDGKTRPLVKETKTLVSATPVAKEAGFPFTPMQCALALLAVVAVLTAVEWRVKGNLWPLDTLLMIVAGCAGIILFLMLFSEHPTTSTNLQLLLLNPLPLVFAWRVVKNMRRGRKDRFFVCASVLIVLFMACGFWQGYAEGMTIVALSLLLRCVRRLFDFTLKAK